MSAIRDPYSGRTIGSADKRWHEIEHDLDILNTRRKKFRKWAEHFKLSYLDLDLTEYDDWGDQIRRLTEEQSHLEMFLIENEAPGWTST